MDEREHEEILYYPIPSPLGEVQIAPTRRTSLHVHSDSLRVFGVEYVVNLRLEVRDGKWQVCREGGLLMRKIGRPWNEADPSAAAVRKLREVLIPLAEEWVTANPQLCWKGEATYLSNCIWGLEGKIAEVEEELRKLRRTRSDLYQEETETRKRTTAESMEGANA